MNQRTFKPSETHKLDDPARLTWLPPNEVIACLKLSPGMTVADIGTGTGYFALPIAREITPDGTLFAVDVQPEMLEKLKEKLAVLSAPHNIKLVEGDATNTTLPGGSCDLVLMANLWHELDDHPAALREAARILRQGGRLALLDWRPDVEYPPGPPLAYRVSAALVIHVLKTHGWSLESVAHIGRYSYLIVVSAP